MEHYKRNELEIRLISKIDLLSLPNRYLLWRKQNNCFRQIQMISKNDSKTKWKEKMQQKIVSH